MRTKAVEDAVETVFDVARGEDPAWDSWAIEWVHRAARPGLTRETLTRSKGFEAGAKEVTDVDEPRRRRAHARAVVTEAAAARTRVGTEDALTCLAGILRDLPSRGAISDLKRRRRARPKSTRKAPRDPRATRRRK